MFVGLCVALCMVCALGWAGWTLRGRYLLDEGFMQALVSNPRSVGMAQARRPEPNVVVLEREADGARLELSVTRARSLESQEREQLKPHSVPLLCVRATLTQAPNTSDDAADDARPISLIIPGTIEAADTALFDVVQRWGVRVGWLGLDSVLRGFTIREIPDALLSLLWPEHGERLRARLSARPLGLVSVQINNKRLLAQWHVYPDHIIEHTRSVDSRVLLIRTLVAQVDQLDAELRAGLADPLDIARGLLTEERVSMPLRRSALAQIKAHAPEALDALFDDFWQDPTLRALEIWWGEDRPRVEAAVADASTCRALVERLCPPGTYMSEVQRLALGSLLATHEGIDALWTSKHSGLPVTTFHALCARSDAARDEAVRALIPRLRVEALPDQQDLLLSLPGLGAGPTLAALDDDDAQWLERRMIITLRSALNARLADDALADRVGHVLRWIGRGESIAALQAQIAQVGALQNKRKNMLTAHLTHLMDRLGDRVNPGALTVVGDAQLDGALSLAQDHGALSVIDTPDRSEAP